MTPGDGPDGNGDPPPAGTATDGRGTNGGGTGAATPAPEGPEAPDFTLPTLDGGQISLSDYEGEKVVLLDFWATHCDPCLREMPELVEIYNERKDKGFIVLAVATDGPDTAAAIPAKV
ncbi:MAG: TlpA family protein disulfide reductase, partial [Deltaproteobacteria bacterium]|nr:TlpA family protein disulfide reductase [Deltaproteobacteria bacterium]